MEEIKQLLYHYTERYKFDEKRRGTWVIPRYSDSLWFFATFHSKAQLDRFAKVIGFTYKLREKSTGLVIYECDRNFIGGSNGGFWKLEDLPRGAKPIKALSNGSIVDCYFTNDGRNVIFYRPNPNAKDVYKPLSLAEHIEHTKKYGTY